MNGWLKIAPIVLMRIQSLAQDVPKAILSKEAGKYIGQTLTVYDYDFNYEYHPNKHNPDSAMVLIHLGKRKQCTLILYKLYLRDTAQKKIAEDFENNPRKPGSVKAGNNAIGAEGKIFLFDGKPAIIVNKDDLIIMAPIESPGWRPPGLKKGSQ